MCKIPLLKPMRVLSMPNCIKLRRNRTEVLKIYSMIWHYVSASASRSIVKFNHVLQVCWKNFQALPVEQAIRDLVIFALLAFRLNLSRQPIEPMAELAVLVAVRLFPINVYFCDKSKSKNFISYFSFHIATLFFFSYINQCSCANYCKNLSCHHHGNQHCPSHSPLCIRWMLTVSRSNEGNEVV